MEAPDRRAELSATAMFLRWRSTRSTSSSLTSQKLAERKRPPGRRSCPLSCSFGRWLVLFTPAVDLCAGEKERGTLETLLSSPAERTEIVWGKLFTVMLFSVANAVLNLLAMSTTGLFVIKQLSATFPPEVSGSFAVPPLSSFGWLLLGLLPIAALFSALSLALASLARSSKEGQYYLMPLVLVVTPLMFLPLTVGFELNLGNSLIPVTGVMLLLRSLLEGNYSQACRGVGHAAHDCALAAKPALDCGGRHTGGDTDEQLCRV